MINRKARPMVSVRLSLVPLDESSKRGKLTTHATSIQLNTWAALFKEVS
jgi:hypothetical protein